MGVRVAAAVVLAGAGTLGGVLVVPRIDPDGGVPAAVAGGLVLAVALSWPRARAWVAWPAAAAAVTSLAATGYVLMVGRAGTGTSGPIGFVEVACLLVLLAMVVRWSAVRTMLLVGAATAAAATVWILRYLPSYDPVSIMGGCASMAVAPAFAIVLGGYPRLAVERINWSVRSARRAQRLDIAQDLHDYVAHDLSGMVAQAQAARYAFASDPVRMAGALERIEAAGLQALGAMDEMVAVLADGEATASTRPQAGLGDLPGLVERFGSERAESCRVALTQDPRTADPSVTSRQVQTTAHRVVVEALTNVRRHAPAATDVAVSVRLCDPEERLAVRVANDLTGHRPTSRRASGGTGVVGLRERVRALGGDLTAGPDRDGRWVLQADIPLHPGGHHG